MTDLRAWLVDRVATTLGIPAAEADPAKPLHETGLSSRDAMTLTGDLGRLLGRSLPATLVWEHPTINDLVAALSDVERESMARWVPEPGEPIAVVGLGCRLPGGISSPEEFWRFLESGDDAIGEVPEGRWESFATAAELAALPRRGGFLDDALGFDAAFFGITPREAEAMDPQQRLLLEVAWEALEHAGIPPSSLRGTRTGVFVGLSASEYGYLTMTDVSAIDAWSGTGAAASIAANRLSYLLDLRGPSLTIDTACSSSLVAVHQAVQSLQRGEIGAALVGGVNLLLSPGITANFAEAGVLAADGRCKPFDAAADGIARGEGCGVVVLKPLRAARRDGDRVLAVIRGSAVNSDGRSNGIAAPNPEAQAALLRDAYAVAGLDPSVVDYVEAHGTGTLLGDPIEAGALKRVLGRNADRPLLLGSVKSNLGHLEGAAGITGFIKTVLALSRRRVPASLHYREPNPHIDFDGLRVVTEPTAWPRYSGVARAGVSAFGFGGTNAHVVLEEWPATPRFADVDGPHVFAVSDRSADGLRDRAAELARWVESSDVPLSAVASTLAHHRDHLPVRAAVVASSRAELAAALREVEPGQGRLDGAVFVFSGYGSQWTGMGRRLLDTEPAFAAEVDRLDAVFRAEAGLSLRDMLTGEPPDLAATQLALFGMQVALAGLWRAHGVTPAAVLGQSMGEVAAAVVAGALDVADGLRVMTTRARLLGEIDAAGAGAMAVVEATAAEIAEFPGVEVAVYASAAQCTVTGDADAVAALVSHVEGQGRFAKLLPVSGAGHSPAVDAILDRFRAGLTVDPGSPEVPCYTSVLDDPRDKPLFDVDYWAANLRRPVRFAQALAAAVEDGHGTFVEIAPHPVALAAVEQAGATGLPTASRKTDERIAFLTSLARLHVLGHPSVLTAREPAQPVADLPGTVWRHERFWARRPARTAGHPFLGTHAEVPGSSQRVWRGEIGTGRHPWLADHAAFGTPIFPATGFVELALAAAGPCVTDVELRQILPLGAEQEVTTSLTDGVISVHTKPGGWVCHATARAGEAVPLEPLGAVDGEPVDLYAALDAMGMSYGPAFRLLRDVTAVAGRASAAVGMPKPAGHVLHPALADACLHALAAATGPALREADGLFLPMSIGAVTVAGDPRSGARVDAVVGSLSGDDLRGTVQLVAADDTVLVEFRDVHARRFRRAALPVPLSGKLFEATWTRTDLPGAAEEDRTWVLLHHGEPGLRFGDDRVVVVPPGNREALRAALATRPDGVVWFARDADGPALVHEVTRVVAELAETPSRLWLVTGSAAAVDPGEAGRPDLACLRALVRVLAFEHPELHASLVDVDPESLDRLPDELRADGPDDEIAWRRGVRHTRELTRPRLGAAERPAVRDGAYVITGGLGGLGLVAARWLAERGATRIVLSGRAAREADIPGAVVVAGDIAEPGVADRLVEAATSGGVPLRGVLHAAGVLADGAAVSLTPEQLTTAWRPKATGAWRLHEATLGHDLDWWLVYSSAAALFGSPGQAAYATANAYADALVTWRRAQGLPAATINWGAWGEAGAAVGVTNPVLEPLGTAEALEALDAVLARDCAATGVARLDAEAVLELFPRLADRPFFDLLVPRRVTTPAWPGLDALEPATAHPAIADHLTSLVAGLMGFAPEQVDRHVPLTQLGLDSLLAMRARGAVERDFGLPLPVPMLLRGASLAELAAHLAEQAGFDAGPAPVTEVVVGPRDPAERWVARHWYDVLGRFSGVHEDFPGDPARLRAAMSAELPDLPAELFDRPTIAAMADLLRDRIEGSGPVRCLRSGTGTPVFLFHPAGGPSSVYTRLVRDLPGEFPVYGFERLDEVDTVEAKAARYLDMIREIQPQGPYRLGGWSFGGCLAYECARQLGKPVELVFLIDTILPRPAEAPAEDLLLDRFDRFATHIEQTYGVALDIPRDELARLGEAEQIGLVMRQLAEKVPGLGEGVLHHQYTSYVDARVAERYSPGRYDGPVLLFRAQEPHPLTTALDPRYLREDESLGWDEFCPALEIVPVPGDHVSMIDPPHVSVLAAALGDRTTRK
ncbi:acyltransferase domain-containing protein [Amycolatopsis thermalba]|uniref:Acyltransferase domain-containing protein n=1 Tax=Amycolatopsis thermalba TaxID=944492 RepID=A0ABY4P4K0_9PSEU|nr:type I polyketide synthase [Amycolatopsis thermalba]UQS27201.1 acyltransferase domain-containing protein [Amycolatopsis thermalba]